LKLLKLLSRISKFQPKAAYIIMNERNISHGCSKEISQIAMLAASKRNKWRQSEQYKT
jgi:hypothetical protein